MPRPTTALIVDDEPHVRAFVRLLLREVGIAATWEASDGVRAVELAQQLSPELVFLDVNLPLMTGLQVLAKLRETSPEIPVVMISSESAYKTVQEALRLGAIAYILKHSPKSEALETLQEALASLGDGEQAPAPPPPGGGAG